MSGVSVSLLVAVVLVAGFACALFWWNAPSRMRPVTDRGHGNPALTDDVALTTLRFHASRVLDAMERELLEKLTAAYPELRFWFDVAAYRLMRPGFRRKKTPEDTARYDDMNGVLASYAVELVAFDADYNVRFVCLLLDEHYTKQGELDRLKLLTAWLRSAGIPYLFLRPHETPAQIMRRVPHALAAGDQGPAAQDALDDGEPVLPTLDQRRGREKGKHFPKKAAA